MAELGARDRHDGFEHVPAVFAPDRVARQSPHDEDGLDRFGAQEVAAVVDFEDAARVVQIFFEGAGGAVALGFGRGFVDGAEL